MFGRVNPVPEGYHSITPYLIVKGAAKAIEFYKEAFGAEVQRRLDMPGQRIAHAELKIGDSVIMLADEYPGHGEMSAAKSPETIGGSPVSIHLYIENVDSVMSTAVAAGATLRKPVEDQFYGDRAGSLTDPFGHEWYIATHIEDVSDEDIRKRADAFIRAEKRNWMSAPASSDYSI